MWSRISPLFRPLASVAMLTTLAMFFSGCGVGTPTSPSVEAPFSADHPPPIAHGPEAVASSAQPAWYTVAQQWVNPGVVTTVSGSRYKVKFAAGSLSSPAEISIREYDAHITDFELLPHGITFGTPVTVTVDYRGTNLDPLSRNWDGSLPLLLWLNPSTNLWELVPGINNVLTRTYTFKLSHFSRYALTRQGGTAEW